MASVDNSTAGRPDGAASPPVEQPSRSAVANRTTDGRGARQRRHRNGPAPMKTAAAPRTLRRKREGQQNPKIDSSPGTARLPSPPLSASSGLLACAFGTPCCRSARVIELRLRCLRVRGTSCFPPRPPDDASCSVEDFVQLLQEIYNAMEVLITYENLKCTEPVVTNRKLKQGCHLSPLMLML